MIAKKGTFNAPIATGNSPVSGVGFRPKALILWATNNVVTGYGNTMSFAMGFSASSSDRKTMTMSSDDNVTPSNSGSRYADLAISILSAGTPTVGAEADFVSFDSDGFTLNWTTAGAGKDYIVHYLALAGDDLTGVKVGEFTAATSTGSQAFTGVGFRPTSILLLGNLMTALGNFTSFADFALGVASGPTARGTASAEDRDGQNPTSVVRGQMTDRILRLTGASNAREGDITSFDADGLTIDWTIGTVAHKLPYLALKGPRFKVGADTQRTTTGTKATTGIGFQPKALLVVSFNLSASPTADNLALEYSVGGSDGAAEGCTWMGAADNVATTDTQSSTVTDKVLRMSSVGSVTNAEADLDSLDPDGFTLNWTTVDVVVRQFVYLAFGDGIPPVTQMGPQRLRGI